VGISVLEYFDTTILDAGGRRNERRKWISALTDASVVFLFVNMSGYLRKLYEDPDTPHFREDVEMFEELVDSKFLRKTPYFLILTMSDLFEESLNFSNFGSFEKDYDSIMTPKEYIISKFKTKRSDVTIFETCGFDQERNDYLFELVQKKLKGETLEAYYPYDFIQTKPLLSSKLYDVNFLFS
jgi:hypothetical protein